MTKSEFKAQRSAMRLANNPASQAIVAQREALAAEWEALAAEREALAAEGAVKFNAGMELLAQLHAEISPILCARRDAEDFVFRAKDTKQQNGAYREMLSAIRARTTKKAQAQGEGEGEGDNGEAIPMPTPAVKRGRGRPPGSKNKKTLLLEAALA